MEANRHQQPYNYSIHYRTWHDESDAHAALMARVHREQLGPFLPECRGTPILEIGCGMGFALLALQGLGYTNARGIDRDAAQVQNCRRRNLPVELVTDAVPYLASLPSAFDLVLLLDVLEHVPCSEQISFMRAVAKSLTPTGRAVLTVPNATSPVASRWRYIDYTHHSSFTEHSLRFVLKNAGFGHIHIPADARRRRPPLRLWRRDGRDALRRWLVRLLWRQVLLAEFGTFERVDEMPTGLNIFAVAHNADLQPANE